jgi:hypothetical protein
VALARNRFEGASAWSHAARVAFDADPGTWRARRALAAALSVGAGCGAPLAPVPSVVAPAPRAVAAPVVVDVRGCPLADAGDAPVRFGEEALVPLCKDLLVDASLTTEERRFVAAAYATARERVASALGPLVAPAAIVIVCKSDACGSWFGGVHRRSWALGPGERLEGGSFVAGPRGAILALVGRDRLEAVLVHETVHVEAHVRLGDRFAPAWFHEGLATWMSGEPACSGSEPHGVDDLRRLATNATWNDFTNTEPQDAIGPTYCQARAELDAWVHANGRERIAGLLGRVRAGEPFDEVYGAMRTQPPGPPPTVVTSSAPYLGDPARAFTLALWIKPAALVGVLAHVSATPVGTGFCGPFLGFDASGRIVSQLPHEALPGVVRLAKATDATPRPLGLWTHVAMTWSPGSANRLYVAGALVDEAAAPRYHAPRVSPLYVAWGSSNVGGARCDTGGITAGVFQGRLTGMRVYDAALPAPEIAALARTPP